MAKRRRKQRRKWIFRIFFLLLLVAAVAVCYLVWDGYFNKKETPKGGGDSTTTIVDKKDDEKPTADSGEQLDGAEKEEIIQYDGDNPNENSGLTGVITYAGVSGEYLMIRVNIDQYLSSGRCDLTLTRNGETVFSDATTIIDSASTSTCEGFNVPVSQLGNGNVQVIVNLKSGEKSGVITGEAAI